MRLSMNKRDWFLHPAFYAAMVLYFLAGYSTLGYGEQWAPFFYLEDHYFENVGAVSLFLASALMFYVFVRTLQTWVATKTHWLKILIYLGMALLFFFGAGEEISWGQRIFNISEPPDLAKINRQDELNVHNIVVNGTQIPFDQMFYVFWLIVTVVIPVACSYKESFNQFASKFMPVIHWGIGGLFVFNYLAAHLAKPIYVAGYTFRDIEFPQAVQEVKESNYELLCVVIGLYILWDLMRLIREKSGVQ